MTSRSRLLKDAACIEADPRFFDAVTWEEAEPALTYCGECPVKPICERHVLSSRPTASHFDGVAGGRVWRDGRPVPRPVQWRLAIRRVHCGSYEGRITHLENQERHCAACQLNEPPQAIQMTLGED